MKPIPPVVMIAGMLAVVLGLPFALYALLTRKQRQTMRELRAGARQHDWKFRLRRWQGNPTAFRIDGRTRTALAWVLTTGNSGGSDRGWTVRLHQRFPTLAGEVDLAILPRDPKGSGAALLGSHLSPGAESRIAAFSGTAASAIEFFRNAQEVPSGLPAFDKAYQALALAAQINRCPVDAELAERFVSWPAEAIAPHSLLAWRDPFGFHFMARLPAPPNWATVSYFLALAEDLSARVPPPGLPPAARGFVDRLVAYFLR